MIFGSRRGIERLGSCLALLTLAACSSAPSRRPVDRPELLAVAEELTRTLPSWRPDGRGVDPEEWFLLATATYQMGGKTWKHFNKALKPRVTASMKEMPMNVDPELVPEGTVGGTGFLVLALTVYFRYARMIGAR